MDKDTWQLASRHAERRMTADTMAELSPEWDEKPSLVEQLARAAVHHEQWDGHLRKMLAERFLTNSITLFSLGDDYLDQAPLAPDQSKAILKRWLENIVSPKDNYEPVHEVLGHTGMPKNAPLLTDEAMLAQYRLLDHVTKSIGRDKKALIEAALLTQEERSVAGMFIDRCFESVIMTGEQSTFEVAGRVAAGQRADAYFRDICIAGNADTFLPRHMVHVLKGGELWMPSRADIEQAEKMSCYWQLADDAKDFREDIGESKPKLLFLLNEMDELARLVMNGMEPEVACGDSSWYAFLRDGLGRAPTMEEVFCCNDDDLRGTLRKRVAQCEEMRKIAQRNSYVAEYPASDKAAVTEVMADIDLLPVVRRAALGFQGRAEFSQDSFGEYLRTIYDKKMQKLFGGDAHE